MAGDQWLHTDETLGDFRILERIGEGGMGVVYLALDDHLARQVALKVIAPQLVDDPEFRERFEAEARSAAAIDHPNVVPIYSAGSAGDRVYIAMRYVEGEDLRARLRDRGPFDADEAVEVVGAVAAALDAAHEVGLVHRDVKPANVLLPAAPAPVVAYLTDFGLTKGLQGAGAQLTGTGQWIGSVDYVAPEQMTTGQVDARTDVYALGCVLFETIAGSPPFAGSEMQKMWHQVNEPLPPLPPSPRAASLDSVIARATAKDPDDRFASAGDLALAARAAVEGTHAELAEHSVARGAAAAGMASVADPQRTRTMRGRPPAEPAEAATTRMQTPAAGSPDHRHGGFSGRVAAVIGACLVLAAGLIAAALVVSSDGGGAASRTVVNRPVETVTTEAEAPPAEEAEIEEAEAGASSAASSAPETDSAEAETFTQALYEVDIPGGWEQDEDDAWNGTFYQSTWHPLGDPETTILIDAQAPQPSASPLTSAEIVREQTSQSDGYAEYGFESTTLAGAPAARWVFEVHGDRRVDYFFNGCNSGIAVLGSTSPAAFGAMATTFHEAAASVRGFCGEE
jgi:tRNA A-37 threonylcarbamoyl transferase component Bud32